MCPKEKLCKDDEEKQNDETLFRSLIGCLLYFTITRPNVLCDVSVLSRYMNFSKETHFKEPK